MFHTQEPKNVYVILKQIHAPFYLKTFFNVLFYYFFFLMGISSLKTANIILVFKIY